MGFSKLALETHVRVSQMKNYCLSFKSFENLILHFISICIIFSFENSSCGCSYDIVKTLLIN